MRIRFFLLLVVVFIGYMSCSKDSAIKEGITLYKEGLYQTAYTKFKEGLINYSYIFSTKQKNCIFTSQAVFVPDTLLTLIYPKRYTYRFSREAVSVWYDSNNEICVVTDGDAVYWYKGDREKVIPRPKDDAIKAVAHSGATYFICGQELFEYNTKEEWANKISGINVKAPESMKYYNTYIHCTDDTLVIITGIAGIYNLWVVTKNGNVLLSAVRVASWKHYLEHEWLYVIKGSAGNWDFKKIHIITKQEQTIKKFNNIIDIHMTQNGVLINTGETMCVYYYNGMFYTMPFAYSIKGGTYNSIAIEKDTELVFVDSAKFFDMVDYIATHTGCCVQQ